MRALALAFMAGVDADGAGHAAHEVVRRGVGAYLDTLPAFKVVGEAASGEEAISLVSEYIPDVVLMDLIMPGMDGYEATRRIRETLRSTPIIGLSAHAMSGHEQKAKEAGCNDYLTKPINDQLLFNMLKQYLGE